MKLYHGTPFLFDSFNTDTVGESTGIKYGVGVYLTQVEKTAVHYSQPRNLELTEKHYLYSVEIPDLTDENHFFSVRPVPQSILKKVENKLSELKGYKVSTPDEVKNDKSPGKLFRKWVGTTLTGASKPNFESEKQAAAFFDELGINYYVYPNAQGKPDGEVNITVYNPGKIKIVQIEEIEIVRKSDKWVAASKKVIKSY